MKALLVYCVWIFAFSPRLLLINCELNSGSDNVILKAQCIKEYALTDQFHFGYPMTAKTLMCRCDCSKLEAGLFFQAANENHRIECSDHLKDIKGFCLEKIQQIRTDLYCANEKYVYAFCNIKFTAKRTYEFKNWDIRNITYSIAMPSGETITVPADKEYISINDTKYTVFTKGPPCDSSNSHLRFYNNLDDDEEWIDTCDNNQVMGQFVKTERFIINNDIKYHSKLWYRVNHTEEVCKAQYPSFKFKCESNDMNCFVENCSRVWQKMKFNFTNTKQMLLTYDVKLILINTNNSAKTTTSSTTTTSEFSVMHRLFSNRPNTTPEVTSSQTCNCTSEKQTTTCSNYDCSPLAILVILIGIVGPMISTGLVVLLYSRSSSRSHDNYACAPVEESDKNNTGEKQKLKTENGDKEE